MSGEQSAPDPDQQVSAVSAAEAEEATKVFAPRIPVSMREQVEAIQSLTGQNVNEVGIEALGMWIAAKLADETLGAQALAELDEEERRLQERRANLTTILGRSATSDIESAPEEKEAAIPAAKRGRATPTVDAR